MQCGLVAAVNKWPQAAFLLMAAAAAGFAGYHFNRSVGLPATKMAVQRLLLLPLADFNGKTQTLLAAAWQNTGAELLGDLVPALSRRNPGTEENT